MEWENIVVDEKNMSLLFEFPNSTTAERVSNELSKAIWGKGELSDLDGYVNGTVCAGKYVAVATDASREELDCIIDFVRELSNVVEEDFSMGVSGPTGLNQGIPHGGPGKGCLPKPLYNPKAKAVPAKEKDDKDTEENLKKLRAAKKLLKNEGFSLVRENAAPEYFCRNPFTVEDLENYLHDDDGFSWDEVDCLIDNNRELITSMLEQGKSPEEVSADLDDSCLKDLEA
jgi:hypothetical protein